MSEKPAKVASISKLPKMRWVMLSFAFVATVMNYVDRLAFNYLSADGPLREIIPDDAFGYIGGAFFVGYMLSNLGSGFLVDKLGTRLGYSLCMAFWTTASLLQTIAAIPVHFGIIRCLLGIGEAGNWPAAIKLTGEWFSPEERSTAIGIFNSGGAIGAIITPPLIIWLGNAYGWQTAFICVGGVGYLWLGIFWFVYYTPEYARKAAQENIFSLKQLLRTRFVSWFTISKAFMDPIWYFLTFWIARYLVDVHGWSLTKNDWLIVLPFLMADAGNMLGGYFTQFIIKKGIPVHKARKIAVGIFGSILSLSLLLGPILISSPNMALFILGVAAFSHAAYTCNSMAFPSDVVPASATASVWGIASVGAGFGGMIFQSVSGITINNLSATYSYTIAYNAVFVGYGLCALAGLFIVLFLMGPLTKDKKLFERLT